MNFQKKVNTSIKQILHRIPSSSIYWSIIFALIFIKLILVSDLAPKISYSPHDALLYVKKAYMLLTDGSFGQYDSRLLVKLPGISFLFAFFRILGIPMFLANNVLLIVSALYLVAGIQLFKIPQWLALLSFSLIIYHPFTESEFWIAVQREPADIIFHCLLLGSLFQIFYCITKNSLCFLHTCVLAVSFSLSLLTREEGILVFALLGFSFVSALFLGWRLNTLKSSPVRLQLVMLLLAPLMVWLVSDSLARWHTKKHYGLPILHEFSEGEYPRFIAAIRSVGNDCSNRLISISQEQLKNISNAVPMLKPLVDALPKPGPGSWSDIRFGIKDEWTNSHIFFWIRDSANNAGLFHNLSEAQDFFRNGRLAIEKACSEGKLDCVPDGSSLLPGFKFSWIRPMFEELPLALKYTFSPYVQALNYVGPFYDVWGGAETALVFQSVTMTHHYREFHPDDEQDDLFNALHYWLRYPDVARSIFGPNHTWNEGSGALAHYLRHGKTEGRLWKKSKLLKQTQDYNRLGYFSILDNARSNKNEVYFKIYPLISGLAVFSTLVFTLFIKRSLCRPIALMGLVTAGYFLIKIFAFLYISVPMGRLDQRLYASMSLILCAISPVLVYEAWMMIKVKFKS